MKVDIQMINTSEGEAGDQKGTRGIKHALGFPLDINVGPAPDVSFKFPKNVYAAHKFNAKVDCEGDIPGKLEVFASINGKSIPVSLNG